MRNRVNDLSKSIVQYKHQYKSVCDLLDIGCSDGLMLDALFTRLGSSCRFTGIDISEPMLNKARERFSEQIMRGQITISNCDLRTDFPSGEFDLITSILSIQFTPIEYRQHIIQNIYDSLSDNKGCFIMVEKVLGNTDYLNKLMVDTYYTMKEANGYSQEQIERKRLSLEGVLVPVTNEWNIQLLKQSGFRQVDVFWRWMNFVGYIAIK